MKKSTTIESIFEAVTKHTGIPEEEIKMPDKIKGARKAERVEAREIFCFLARQYTYYSLAKIGTFINRDHASVLSSTRSFDSHYYSEKEYRNLVNDIKGDIIFLSVKPIDKKVFTDAIISRETLGEFLLKFNNDIPEGEIIEPTFNDFLKYLNLKNKPDSKES